MKKSVRIAVVAFSMAVTGVIAASPALAYNTPSYWNVSSTPLTVKGFGSTAKGYGHIKIFNGSNGTRMYATSYNKFTDGDNHRSYLDGGTQYNAGSCRSDGNTVIFKGAEVSSSSSCAAQFYGHGSFRQDGLNYTKNDAWVGMPSKNMSVDSGADRGRAEVKMSIDVPFRSDPQSGASYSAADSW